MLSLKDFKEVEIGNDFSIIGGACTGGGGMITTTETRTISLPDGSVVIQQRNWYMDWSSDESTDHGIIYYDKVYSVGDWY